MTTDTETPTREIVATRRHDRFGVTNPEGEWVEIDPIEPGYCRHGKYVGGIGIDWICGPCEMGEGDYTEFEIQSVIDRRMLNMSRVMNNFWMIAILADGPFKLESLAAHSNTYGNEGHMLAHALQIKSDRDKLANSPDDDGWLARAQDEVADLCYVLGTFEREGPPVYTEVDEIHEYGYVPDTEEI